MSQVLIKWFIKPMKAKIQLDQQQLSYLLGLLELDIRYSKDKEYLEVSKGLFKYFKEELEKLYLRDRNNKNCVFIGK